MSNVIDGAAGSFTEHTGPAGLLHRNDNITCCVPNGEVRVPQFLQRVVASMYWIRTHDLQN